MVNYHTSTLLESSEHVFELIRYNFFWRKSMLHHPTVLVQLIEMCLAAHCVSRVSSESVRADVAAAAPPAILASWLAASLPRYAQFS